MLRQKVGRFASGRVYEFIRYVIKAPVWHCGTQTDRFRSARPADWKRKLSGSATRSMSWLLCSAGLCVVPFGEKDATNIPDLVSSWRRRWERWGWKGEKLSPWVATQNLIPDLYSEGIYKKEKTNCDITSRAPQPPYHPISVQHWDRGNLDAVKHRSE